MQDSSEGQALIIFVDAYPHHNIEKLKSLLPEGFVYSPLIPTFGFSINQKALLFGGKYPDECGYFNEWVPKEGKITRLEKFLSMTCWLMPAKIEGLAHKIYSKINKLDYYRIPFGMKYLWKRNPTEIYNRTSSEQSLLTEYSYERVLYMDMKSTLRDEMVFNKLTDMLNERVQELPDRIFVTLADCDSRLHRTGGRGEGSLEICEYYAEQISKVVQGYLEVRPKASVVILSDHGMSDVKAGFDAITILKTIANPSFSRFIYFVDATMLRVWYLDDVSREEVRRAFKNEDEVLRLSDVQRERYAISSKEFGDDIFTVASDDLMFEPNFYGRKRVNGMHGYLPHFESQKGIFITNRDYGEAEINAKDVFGILCDVS